MRYILAFILLMAYTGCQRGAEQKVITITDTVTIVEFQDMPCDDDSVGRVIDSMNRSNQILARKLLYAKLTIGHAKYYLAIANRNPSQGKFLKGWQNRVFQNDSSSIIKPTWE